MADAPAGAPAERATATNVFTRKIGPLPMIAWVGIIGGGIVVWAYMKNRSGSKATAAGDGSTPASDVPQFVNQTYLTTTAPTVTQPGTNPGTGSGTVSTGKIPVGGGDGGPSPKPPGVGDIGEGERPGIHPKHPVKRPGKAGQPVFNSTYVVKPGDTLASVAKKYKITREQLAHANGYGTGAGLRTGEKLKVPAPAGTGTPNRAP